LRHFAHNLRREPIFFIWIRRKSLKSAPILTNKTKQIEAILLGFAWFFLDGFSLGLCFAARAGPLGLSPGGGAFVGPSRA
jgi:hypothetical protein